MFRSLTMLQSWQLRVEEDSSVSLAWVIEIRLLKTSLLTFTDSHCRGITIRSEEDTGSVLSDGTLTCNHYINSKKVDVVDRISISCELVALGARQSSTHCQPTIGDSAGTL